jgi:hypothetical protein
MRKLNAIVLASILAVGIFGCTNTKPIQTTIKIESGLIAAVDGSMKGWSDYVRSGMATQQQVNDVKQAYNTYYNSQQVAKAAIEQVIITGSTNQVDVQVANTAMNNAASSLISIINIYTIKH